MSADIIPIHDSRKRLSIVLSRLPFPDNAFSAMVSAFVNIFKIPDLRQRILFTLAMIVIVRIGYQITLPGVDPAAS